MTITVFFILAITTWISYFCYSADFGLYVDDLYRVVNTMDMSVRGLIRLILKLLSMKFEYGRPIHSGSIYLLSFLGHRLGGLHIVYWIGYIIVTTNTFLFFLLLKRLSKQPKFAFIGALTFCLFPADTTRAWLTSSLGLQPSLTFLFLALHSYLSKRKKLSYFAIIGSVLCYETVFPIFLIAPLLNKKWNLRLLQELFKHILILGGIFMGIVILRKFAGESRIGNLDMHVAFTTSINHMLMGPVMSMRMFLYAPVEVLLKFNWDLLIFLPLCFLGLIWSLYQFQHSISVNSIFRENSTDTMTFSPATIDCPKSFTKLALVGLIALILAYPLTLIGSLTSITATASRIHFAAVVGASILCAYICSFILHFAGKFNKKRLVNLGLATFFSLLIGFGLIVQKDFRLSWQYQRAFWTDVLTLCPDLTDGTVILVEPTGLRNPKYITAFKTQKHAQLLHTSKIYRFPKNWQNPPFLALLSPSWQEKIVLGKDLFKLDETTIHSWVGYRNVKSSDIIFLEVRDNHLIRRTDPLTIGSQEFQLKEKALSVLPNFEKGPLYDYLIRSDIEKPVKYFCDGWCSGLEQ